MKFEGKKLMILSFSITTKAFLSGEKSVTRRFWKPAQLMRWQRARDEKRLIHDAWDRIPIAGGRKIGRFRLTARPYLERLKDMPESDLAAEGGMCRSIEEFIELVNKTPDTKAAVIRFEKL